MKVALAFHCFGVNDEYQKPIWEQALKHLGWRQTSMAEADCVVMWGNSRQLVRAHRLKKPALVLDFPYWNRAKRTGEESWKISLNGQHPTDYLFNETLPGDRFDRSILPWKRNGKYILLCGMGPKACDQYKYCYLQWEKKAFAQIRKYTNMPVVFRPKPNRRPDLIDGCEYDDGSRPIADSLMGAHAVVCHHGNPAVEALENGVPVFTNGLGAASHLSLTDLSKIMDPFYPKNRKQFLNNLSYWQWHINEIRIGAPLLSMKNRGLI